MPKKIFKVRVIKGFGKMLEGMEFQVTSAHPKPFTTEIKKAFEEKYGFAPPYVQDKYMEIS